MLPTEIVGVQVTLLGVASLQLAAITNGVPGLLEAGLLCLVVGTGAVLVGIVAEGAE